MSLPSFLQLRPSHRVLPHRVRVIWVVISLRDRLMDECKMFSVVISQALMQTLDLREGSKQEKAKLS